MPAASPGRAAHAAGKAPERSRRWRFSSKGDLLPQRQHPNFTVPQVHTAQISPAAPGGMGQRCPQPCSWPRFGRDVRCPVRPHGPFLLHNLLHIVGTAEASAENLGSKQSWRMLFSFQFPTAITNRSFCSWEVLLRTMGADKK